ncbi:DUF7289 family protein [Methanolobus halotolerans]|uniref:DUF7308 domain-containing protein n=1 Tax=Methanolobus halotolerans TaxID=2052935 RepID=A0A4E0Q2Y7_9EURY|nr:hypothetical protein [Methanolobus halotolerans]TGC07306.1 hypothetical protein CUN85_11675 [Methanolobus halotolerans]
MKKISKNDTAVSSVIGISIILVISLLSIGLLLLYTAPLISETQNMAKAQKIEQAFTVFDSRVSKSSLGESPLQTTGLSLMGENVEVHGTQDSYNESSIMIVLLSSNSSWYSSFYPQRGVWNAWKNYEGETDFAGFNASMGKVRYYSGDRVIAYEGGGVWSRYPSGGTVMISPPEFHYNGETLTLPVMKVNGNDSTGGSSNVNINVGSSNVPVLLYPNTSMNANFTNPLNCNKILIYINSEFYDGWAEYAETLTSTTATLDHENQTAIIEMDTRPEMGTFFLTNPSFKIAALNHTNTTPFSNFSFYFYVDGSADFFKSSGMTLTATSGTKTLVYSFYKNNLGGNVILAAAPSFTSYAIEYKDSLAGINEIWESDPNSYFTVYSFHQGNTKWANCTVDLLSDSYLMNYDSNHPDFSWGPVSSTSTTPDLYIVKGNANSTQSLNNITQHYMRLLAQDGTIECTWEQKHNEKIEVDDSTYTLNYDGGGAILTYLHITSNELNVTLE